LRSGSYNTALLRAAIEASPPGLRIEAASIREVPLYDGDREAEGGIPVAVRELKDRIASAAARLLVTPEYNNSIPGVFQNALDWHSRPASDIGRVFGGRPVGLMGVTPGRGGTILAQSAWLPVLRALGTRPWHGGVLHVSGAQRVFDESGKLVDDQIRSLLEKYMAGFAGFVERESRAI
jgi:NAD(P)H-dependent FMN reductase